MTAVLARRLFMAAATILFVYFVVGGVIFYAVPRGGWVEAVIGGSWGTLSITLGVRVWRWSRVE